jgi:hypothetical protein
MSLGILLSNPVRAQEEAAAPADQAVRVAAPDKSEASHDAPSRTAPPAMLEKLRHRKELEQARNASTDYLGLVLQWVPAARQGDAESQMMIVSMMRSCGLFQGRSVEQARKYIDEKPGIFRNDREGALRLLGKCERLMSAPAEEVGTEAYWVGLAIQGGDGRALLIRANAEGREVRQRVDDLHRAIDTKDPEVLVLILRSYMLDSDGVTEKFDPWGSAAEDFLVAATLAGCTLSGECSVDAPCPSQMPIEACPPWPAMVRRVKERHPDRFPKVRDYALLLVDNFLRSSYDWPEAVTYEDQLRNPRRKKLVGA